MIFTSTWFLGENWVSLQPGEVLSNCEGEREMRELLLAAFKLRVHVMQIYL